MGPMLTEYELELSEQELEQRRQLSAIALQGGVRGREVTVLGG